MPTMTDAEYVSVHGGNCPFCRSTNISGGNIEAEGDSAWSRITCDDCGKGWTDLYTLTGFESEEDEGCPVDDPGCDGRSDQCHDTCVRED